MVLQVVKIKMEYSIIKIKILLNKLFNKILFKRK